MILIHLSTNDGWSSVISISWIHLKNQKLRRNMVKMIIILRGVRGLVDKCDVSILIWKLMVRFPLLPIRTYWLINS